MELGEVKKVAILSDGMGALTTAYELAWQRNAAGAAKVDTGFQPFSASDFPKSK